MNIIVDDSARDSISNIFSYNFKYSPRNAVDVNTNIQLYINDLIDFPYFKF